MWDYTDKVKDHFNNPRNVGTIDNPDGVGTVGSLACGDALRLFFRLDAKKERIVEVKFQTFGCASAIASSSALTELIVGKTLAEAAKVTNKDIADFLGGLPDQKMHCSVMGRDALHAAIENYRHGNKAALDEAQEVVCVCFGVKRDEIERVVRENGLTTVEQVTNFTKAGGGCGGCRGMIAEILEHMPSTTTKEIDKFANISPPKKKLTNLQKIKLIEETFEREIRPALTRDGGNIELIDVDGNNVYVSLRGTCAGCKASHFTLDELVTKKLREFVSEDLVVIADNKMGCSL